MENNRLNILQNDLNKGPPSSPSPRKEKRIELQAKFDRLWLVDPKHMDPMRNCMERERINRTMDLVEKFLVLDGKKAADLGCGSGVISRKLRDAGATVDAVDISKNALKTLEQSPSEMIHPIHEYVPMTTLKDDCYDLVLSTELIANLPSDEYRLYFSELSRIVKSDGYVVCSTLIDINSEDALQRFANLAETEFRIDKWIFSHHLCYLRLADFIKAPERFARASRDKEYRLREFDRRFGISKIWFRLNSSKPVGVFWTVVQYPLKPILKWIRQSRSILIALEKICSFLWSDSGISHAIFIGQRRPMVEILPQDEIPKELKHKKQVWE